MKNKGEIYNPRLVNYRRGGETSLDLSAVKVDPFYVKKFGKLAPHTYL
jgi:hypothetical protein